MKDEQYTYEDYLRDFELDHLGFEGIPDVHVPDPAPEKTTENESGPKDGNLSDDLRSIKY